MFYGATYTQHIPAKAGIHGCFTLKWMPAFRLRQGFAGQVEGMTKKDDVIPRLDRGIQKNSLPSVTHKTAAGIIKQPRMHTNKHE